MYKKFPEVTKLCLHLVTQEIEDETGKNNEGVKIYKIFLKRN